MAEIDPLAFQRGFQATQGIFDTVRQNRLADLAFGQKQQELAQQNALASIVGNPANYDEAGNLRREAIPQIAQASPASLPQYQKVLQEQTASQAAAQKAKRAELMDWISYSTQRMANVTDQGSWDAFRAEASQVNPELAARLPAQYDANRIKQAQANAVPYFEQLKLQQRQAEQETQRRGQDITLRGQDITAGTARRGQDITVRGQDLTDARTREANAQKAAEGKAPTEFQSKSATFGARAREADRILSSLDYSPAALSAKQAASNVPIVGGLLGATANLVTSPQNQQAEQAQRDFVNAVLRQESGAAIGQSEFDNARKQYFPQPGDSQAVIEQKAANRRTAIEGLNRGAGKSAFEAPQQPGTPARIGSKAEFDALPSGTLFVAPDGTTRRKP